MKKVLLFGDGSSRVDMGPPELGSEVELRGFRFLRVSMGNPHAVAFLESEREVEAWISAVATDRRRPPLPREDERRVRLRPGQARRQDEDLGARRRRDARLGFGLLRVAVAAVRLGLAESPVRVPMDGGAVEIEWAGEGKPVYIEGPAEYVCEGELFPQVILLICCGGLPLAQWIPFAGRMRA